MLLILNSCVRAARICSETTAQVWKSAAIPGTMSPDVPDPARIVRDESDHNKERFHGN